MVGFSRGTGQKLGTAVNICAAILTFVACALSAISMWYQLKNYRKPLLQRFVNRILLMVPLYAICSWFALSSFILADIFDPIRDIYEAFVIYCFFNLLINYLGGERSVIIMNYGRPPINHPWPLNHFFNKVEIGDPHTFLAIKRGILQYAWMKPILAVATIIMKVTGTFKEGYIGLTSGYLWSGLLYNASVTISLYSLALFWVCENQDLKPFRPMPKFLNIKLVIFASYWQGFLLSILVWIGFLPTVSEYTTDNLARAIQDALICIEMPLFAIGHWYAFSYKDYCDASISSARLPFRHALRDSFGLKDVIEDTKDTFLRGRRYGYRAFDSSEAIRAYEGAGRNARMSEGLRYTRDGKGKYWLPPPTSSTSLLSRFAGSGYTVAAPEHIRRACEGIRREGRETEDIETKLDQGDEELFKKARTLEFGDYNYPVIPVQEPWQEWAERENHRHARASAQENIRKGVDAKIVASLNKGKGKALKLDDSAKILPLRSNSTSSSASAPSTMSTPSEFGKIEKDGLRDLVYSDPVEEERLRVRGRKQGPLLANIDPKVFIDALDGRVQHGNVDPSEQPAKFAIGNFGELIEESTAFISKSEPPTSSYKVSSDPFIAASYGSFREERTAWEKK
ncbi:Transmembrane protein 184 [Neolecta irregularis DAH-3]|uniref:Transmembrane protein 184 n=1 Tax=Neolecta irregularis (strain DAH-3) TaxID=1198029 RepID=A0A1U7LVK9_NEOID|nr:Transmembrane protein 184 [Neolecta irregularis DAH-3]|eukprot:OLL26551.1 Transmembrane protein 184 [Neolecta irregularis DAH-3]